jgi:predicted ABC-type exoprotein transport system permease subunit
MLYTSSPTWNKFVFTTFEEKSVSVFIPLTTFHCFHRYLIWQNNLLSEKANHNTLKTRHCVMMAFLQFGVCTLLTAVSVVETVARATHKVYLALIKERPKARKHLAEAVCTSIMMPLLSIAAFCVITYRLKSRVKHYIENPTVQLLKDRLGLKLYLVAMEERKKYKRNESELWHKYSTNYQKSITKQIQNDPSVADASKMADKIKADLQRTETSEIIAKYKIELQQRMENLKTERKKFKTDVKKATSKAEFLQMQKNFRKVIKAHANVEHGNRQAIEAHIKTGAGYPDVRTHMNNLTYTLVKA